MWKAEHTVLDNLHKRWRPDPHVPILVALPELLPLNDSPRPLVPEHNNQTAAKPRACFFVMGTPIRSGTPGATPAKHKPKKANASQNLREIKKTKTLFAKPNSDLPNRITITNVHARSPKV